MMVWVVMRLVLSIWVLVLVYGEGVVVFDVVLVGGDCVLFEVISVCW